MKRILPLLLIFFCFQLAAQNSGLIVGINLTASTTNHWGLGDIDREYIHPIRGIYPGVNIEYVFHKVFSIKSGLGFEKIGISCEAIASNISRTEHWNIIHSIYYEYLTIPVLLSYSTQGAINFYLNGGVFGGIHLKTVSEFYSDKDNSTSVDELEDFAKPFDVGLSFGLGISKLIGERFYIDLGIRDNLGLVNILYEANYTGNLRTNSLGVVLAVKLKL